MIDSVEFTDRGVGEVIFTPYTVLIDIFTATLFC